MITLHESNITSFPLDNGIGVLSDAIKAYTEEELNGMFEFYMEYDSEGHLVDELKEERIIKAKAQDKLGYQLFRIYSITKNHENDNLIVNAQHITYDLANNFVGKLEARSLTKKQVMEKIGASTVIPHSFNITSSNTTTISSTSLYRTNPLQMVAGMEGSVLQIWGGQIERDNFNLIIHDRRGHDDGVKVTYEKNITGLEATFDISGLVTRIFPYVFIEATDDEPERLITVTGKYIDSPHINDYEQVYLQPIDYSSDERIDTQDKTDAQIRQQLERVAKDYFKENGNDKIKVEMDVAFVHLWETEEYKDVKVLELVGMGDTVTINHSKLKVDATAIVNYIKYDCIAQVNEEVKLGSVKARLTDSINKIDTIERKVEDAQTSANQAIISANGKNTTYYGPDEPIEGMQKGDLWFQVIDGQYHKTYRFDGIEWQLIVDMDSQEAKEQAQQAKDRAEDAVNRANQATADANTAIGQAQASFDLAQENAFELETLGLRFNDVEGNLTTISSTVQGLQTTVSDIDGNVANLTVISSTLQARLSDVEGNVNTLTLTSKSMQSTISSLQDDWNNLEIGEINLILKSNQSATSTSYLVKEYFISEDFIPGEEYTAVIKGNINSGQVFGLWQNVGSSRRGFFEDIGNGLFTLTFSSAVTTLGNERRVRIYNYPSSGASSATIEWIKLVKANKTSLSWSPAPEDLATQTQITQLSDIINFRVVHKGDVLSQINLEAGRTLIDTDKLILSANTTHVTGDFKIDGSANIKDASIGTAQIGTIDGAIANIINLSANSIVGGILSSQNDNMTLDMNTGRLHMQRASYTLGSGADIEFLDRGNKLYFNRKDPQGSRLTRSAGIGVSLSINDRFPVVYMGTSTSERPVATTDERFSGFIANTRARRDNDGIGNSVIGLRFDVRNEAIDFDKGFTFDLSSNSKPEIKTINGHAYDYQIGPLHRILGKQTFEIVNYYNEVSGWMAETQYRGDGTGIVFRGRRTQDYNYIIGEPTHRITSIFLKNNPNVSSDERLKTDISDIDLGLDFINRIKAKQFRLKLTDADIIQGVAQNKLQYGVIAQQVNSVLADFGVSDNSLITESEDGYYGAQYGQFIAPLIKSVQELDTKLTDNVEFLKLKVQYLEQKIKLLEEKVA